MKPLKRVLRYARWVVPAALFAFLVFLVFLWLHDARAGAPRVEHERLPVEGLHDGSTGDAIDPRGSKLQTAARSPRPSPRNPVSTDMNSYLTKGGALALVVVRNGAIVCESSRSSARERAQPRMPTMSDRRRARARPGVRAPDRRRGESVPRQAARHVAHGTCSSRPAATNALASTWFRYSVRIHAGERTPAKIRPSSMRPFSW